LVTAEAGSGKATYSLIQPIDSDLRLLLKTPELNALIFHSFEDMSLELLSAVFPPYG
jgi:hypothetical protein